VGDEWSEVGVTEDAGETGNEEKKEEK